MVRCRKYLPPPRDVSALLESREALLIRFSQPQQHALWKLFFPSIGNEDTLNPNFARKTGRVPGIVHRHRGVALRPSRKIPTTSRPTSYAFLGRISGSVLRASPAVPSAEHAATPTCSCAPSNVSSPVLDDTINGFFSDPQSDVLLTTLKRRVCTLDETALRDILNVKPVVSSALSAPSARSNDVLTIAHAAAVRRSAVSSGIYDHVLRINDSLDTYRELLSSTMDSYLTQVSNRLGTATKALSVVATMSLPFVVVSGMWGMNFATIPLSQWPHGFWFMVVIQLLLGGLLLGFLRRKRLI